MSRIQLSSIKALTLYDDSPTLSRRTAPIPQLICRGKPCALYKPEVVRCESLGGTGTEVDWTCHADLPDSLRFGRVEISCEGWDGPGDPYVLKGSCSLEYRLVSVPGALRNAQSYEQHHSKMNWLKSLDISGTVFMIIWISFLILVLYSVLKSCLRGSQRPGASSTPSSGPRPGNSGWFPGHHPDDYSPPPYSKQSEPAGEAWRPGFWTGAALASLGTHMFNNRRQAADTPPRSTPWDWERIRGATSSFSSSRASENPPDRGEGSSNLGAMRRSTGIGGSNVR